MTYEIQGFVFQGRRVRRQARKQEVSERYVLGQLLAMEHNKRRGGFGVTRRYTHDSEFMAGYQSRLALPRR